MDEFTPFNDKLAGLIASLSPSGRRWLSVDIAKKLRQRQQQRIKAQTAPDGSPFTPRKRPPVRAKKSRIKRDMFTKLRTNRFMKGSGDDSAALVEFTGKVQRIARVHQLGLKDKPSRNNKPVRYDARPLIGFSSEDKELIESIILTALK